MNNPAMPMYGNKNLHSSRWVSSPEFTLPSSAKQEVCNPPAKSDSLKIVIGLVLAALSYTAGYLQTVDNAWKSLIYKGLR